MSAANPASSNGSVGSILRESRESQGTTLEDAARVTRIGKSYLIALEEDNFDSLPNSAYAKGFLRAYAGFLGLSGNEIVARYEKSLAPYMHPPEEERKVSRAKPRARGTRRGGWFISAVLLALVMVAAYLYDYLGVGAPKPAPQVAAPPALPKAPQVMPALSSAQHPAAKAELPLEKEKALSPPLQPSAQQGGVVLRLKVNQDCWLNITIDDAISQQYNLKPGDLIEWKGEKSFVLDLGNPAGVEAEFNGKPLQQFGERGKPAHVTLKAPGVP